MDCGSTNVLCLVTCLMCPDHKQFGSFATDMRKQLKDYKESILDVLGHLPIYGPVCLYCTSLAQSH